MPDIEKLLWMAIPLTQGLFALVDGEDYEWLNQWKWCACKGHTTYYAVRYAPTQKGKRRWVRMHREILRLSEGVQADHRNSYGLDNRKVNLRPATHNQNQWNRLPQSKTSKYKGVSWNKQLKKWHTKIQFNNKQIHIGVFDSEIEAAKAYDRKAQELFGEFAHTNF